MKKFLAIALLAVAIPACGGNGGSPAASTGPEFKLHIAPPQSEPSGIFGYYEPNTVFATVTQHVRKMKFVPVHPDDLVMQATVEGAYSLVGSTNASQHDTGAKVILEIYDALGVSLGSAVCYKPDIVGGQNVPFKITMEVFASPSMTNAFYTMTVTYSSGQYGAFVRPITLKLLVFESDGGPTPVFDSPQFVELAYF